MMTLGSWSTIKSKSKAPYLFINTAYYICRHEAYRSEFIMLYNFSAMFTSSISLYLLVPSASFILPSGLCLCSFPCLESPFCHFLLYQFLLFLPWGWHFCNYVSRSFSESDIGDT